MTVQRVEFAAAMFTTLIFLELELLRLLWTAGAPSASLKTHGAPRLQGDWRESAADQSASTYPASGNFPHCQDGDTRASVLMKELGVERRFLNQASETPLDRISGRTCWPTDALRPIAELYAATGGPVAANLSARRSTAHATLASL